MFQLRSLLRYLNISRSISLEDAIERHIQSTGTGFEIDDIVSCGRYPRAVTDRLYELSQKYQTSEYPIGISNPASFDELKLLARDYSEISS